MNQPTLIPTSPRFDGADVRPEDHPRLADQLARVYAVLQDGKWWTVGAMHTEIRRRFGIADPEPSLSAQLRNLRKSKFGGHQVERQRLGAYSHYRLIRPEGVTHVV